MSKHIAWIFPAFAVGGAQMRFVTLATTWGRSAHHSIISLNGDYAARMKLPPVVTADYPDVTHIPGRMLAAVANARATLRRIRPDVVVTSNWGAIEWAIGARLAGIPHVHTEDGFGPEERAVQLPRRVLMRRLVLRGSTMILPSRTLLTIALDTWRLPPARLHYIPNGIDTARFAGAVPVALPPGEGPVIGTVAALRPEKNIARLIEAFAMLRRTTPARLVIAGDGAERPALEAQVRARGIEGCVVFTGYTVEPERVLAALDVFALSSDTEQMPLSLLEAMASGLPLVATDVGDVRTMVAESNLPFITGADSTAMAIALAALLRVERAAIGEANRHKAVADYSLERMASRYAAILKI